MQNNALRQIKASYTDTTIRVYQAYSLAIVDTALAQQTFVSPPFKMERMTWIKPSFLWMMYRAGWGFKDAGQARILAIDMKRTGFEWALQHSCLSHPGPDMNEAEWQRLKASRPVRIQWDPERDLHLNPQTERAIQMGLSGDAVQYYVHDWIQHIEDITLLAHTIYSLVQQGRLNEAQALLPQEQVYQPEGEYSW